MTQKIVIKKLDLTGHSSMALSIEAAYNYLQDELDEGNLIYSPDLKNVFRNFADIMLNIGKIKELVVIPPVAGG